MVQNKDRARRELAGLAMLLMLSSGSAFAQDDPPSRVARLNYLNGNVSMEPAGVNDWAPADLNRPFTIGDYLYADQGAAAELHLDVAVIRMGAQTSFGFLNLDDRTVQLKLSEGDLSVRIHNFGSDQVFEVDTPNAAVTLLRDGVYRFRVDANGSMSFVVVREGQAEITGEGQAFSLNADNSATLTGTDALAYNIQLAPQQDEFDQWCQQRDAHEASLASARYLPPSVVGAEDLGDYGNWQNTSDYGSVWYPRSVEAGWAPYQNGHWVWIDPWGWTWVDSMPWGFAPFHYGRWAYIQNRWGWCPGPIGVGYRGPVVRPYYAPAMVAWFGGSHWGVGISVGGGPSLGWVPLGWGELYTPSYRCSPRYFNNVNVYNTRVVNNVNITNVYRNVYINKTVYNQTFVNARAPNAVMAMPQSAFASGRPVRQAGMPVRNAEFAQMRAASVTVPPVGPTRQAVLANSMARPAVRPAAQVINRAVMARSAPPSVQPSVVTRTGLAQRAVQPIAPNVRQVQAAAPITVRPGQRGGVAAVAQPTPTQQPAGFGRPASVPRSGVSGPTEQPTANDRYARPANGTRPEGATAPAGHGVPPNMRRDNPNSNSANGVGNNPGGRFPERTPAVREPAVREPAPQNQIATPPRTQERSQPTPNRAPQPSRVEEQNQPVNSRQAPRPQSEPRDQPAAQDRRTYPTRPAPQEQGRPLNSQPSPRQQADPRNQPPAQERRTYPTRPPEQQERSQPNRTEARPTAAPREEHRPAPQNDNHPKNDKKN